MANADALSHLPLPELPADNVPQTGDHTFLIHQLKEAIVTSDSIRSWSDKDPIISRVRRFIQYGWNTLCDDSSLTLYFSRQNELSVLEGCVLWGSRVVIPKAGHNVVLNQLHETHALARCFVRWPGIDSDIESKGM